MSSYQYVTVAIAVLATFVQAQPLSQDATLASNYFQSDMRLNEAQLTYLTSNAPLMRNVYLWSGYYWPQSTLVYSIASDFSSADVKKIERAMAQIAAGTCVRFRRSSNPSEPQVVIQRKDSGCWSYVGYLHNRQALNLGTGCMYLGTIQHELLHALAFLHMQSDPQRDKFVRIVLGNVQPGKEHNFNAYNIRDVGDFGLGYDYDSIMHYGAYAFSKNGQPTIVPLQQGARIGQRQGLSVKDFAKLKRIYC